MNGAQSGNQPTVAIKSCRSFVFRAVEYQKWCQSSFVTLAPEQPRERETSVAQKQGYKRANKWGNKSGGRRDTRRKSPRDSLSVNREPQQLSCLDTPRRHHVIELTHPEPLA